MKNIRLKISEHIWLFSGLLLILLYFVVCALHLVTDNANDPVINFLRSVNGWKVFIVVIVIAPLLEEFAFRFWAVKYKWGKIVSSLLIFGYLWIAWDNIYLSIACSLIFVLFAFFFNKFRFKNGFLILYTSVLFAFAHVGNFAESDTLLLVLPAYTGLSFILCYLVSRYSFVFAIAGHSLWNLIILIIAGFFGSFMHPVTVSNDNFDAVITNVSALSLGSAGADSISDNYIYLQRKNSADIISSLYSSAYKIESEDPSLLFYTLEAKGNIDKDILIRKISENLSLCLDTVEKSSDGFEIVIVDEKLFSREDSGFVKMNIAGFVNSIESRTNYWIDAADSIKNRVFFMDINILLNNTGFSGCNMDNMINELRSENGIELQPKNVNRKVVTVKKL
ncbi:MAG: CPBP family intramembrane metalloprotease [Bacteroidales bacterium]|jgi:membrane protease YdiL (CAAX protease family)|nr:CPBP family intramembrane metalloprotease [Bacteroidales bacterium]